jgi:outer membrane protein assembly factor BamB
LAGLVDRAPRFGRRSRSPGFRQPTRAVPTSLDVIEDGRVYGLDLASGKKVWEYEAASPVTSSPAVAKGKVVAAMADDQVICFG